MSQRQRSETICVVGLGYIGLPTAAAFAARGVKVIGVDVNQHAVDTINQGRIHIVEPELDMVVHAAVTQRLLRATTRPEPADVFLVAVPTPFKEGHVPDLGYIETAARSIAPVLRRGNLVILESTSPVGATERMAAWLAECRPDLSFPQQAGEASDIRVAHCPERVLPGHVMRELVENDRVIGGMTLRCSESAAAVYRIFVRGECIVTDARTAEMCKLAENSFRDVNIAFANELSVICDRLGIDVWELIRLANRHPRVNILRPGCGVGGHCIAVDPWFIVSTTPDDARLIRTAREVNDNKPDWVMQKVRARVDSLVAAGRDEASLKIAVLGLAFKADIDDLRESPATQIARQLARSFRAQVLAVEPNIEQLPSSLAGINLVAIDEALTADVVALLVAHREFLQAKTAIAKHKNLIDTVGLT